MAGLADDSPPPIAHSSPQDVSPSVLNAERGAAAIHRFQRAYRHAETPAVDVCSRAVQPLEVKQAYEQAEALLQPGSIVEGAGEAVPALSAGDTDSRRDAMIDTLQRPTSVSVRASEQRLELLQRLGVLQLGVDAAQTARATNAIQKMLAHQLAAVHSQAMTLLTYLPGAQDQGSRGRVGPPMPPVEIARLGNTAARLMEVFQSGAQALQRLRTGGTQRVVVQHQQLVVAQEGHAVVVNNPPDRSKRRGRRRSGGGTAE
jgi:hypothetical protein